MTSRAELKRMRHIFLMPFASIMRKSSKMGFARGLSERIYLFGQSFALSRFSRIGEILSVYSKTDFSRKFVPGISDIDLVLITKDMLPIKEMKVLGKVYAAWYTINVIFPFIAPPQILSEQDFDEYRHANKMSKAGKHFSDWQLIFGQEHRKQCSSSKRSLSGFELRLAFEDMLLNVYESYMFGESYMRRFYLAANNIFSMGAKTHAEESIEKYICGLAGKEFVRDFNLIPEHDYIASQDMQLRTLFYVLKSLEITFSKIYGKKFPERFSCVIPIKNFTYEYFNLDVADYKRFVKSAFSALRAIKSFRTFKKEITQKPKSRFGAEFRSFPVLVTSKLMNSSFLDRIYPYESLALGFKPNYKHLKDCFEEFRGRYILPQAKSIVHKRHSCIAQEKDELVEYAMAYRLLKKNKICINHISLEYNKSFKDINLRSNSPKDKYVFIRSITK